MKTVALLLYLCTCALAHAQTTDAQNHAEITIEGAASPITVTTEAPAEPAYAKALRDDVRRVFTSDDFHQRTEHNEIHARPWLKKWLDYFKPQKRDDVKTPLLPNFSGLAQILKTLLVVILGLALLWLLWKGWQWLSPRISKHAEKSGTAAIVTAQTRALAAQELPDAISQLARQAWKNGDAGTALSLLYRGALRSLEKTHRLSLPASATEGECLRLARRSGKAVVAEGFAPIVHAWVALAYAGHLPDDFEKLLLLYSRYFDSALPEKSVDSATMRTAG